MNRWGLAFGLAGLSSFFIAVPQKPSETVVFLSGNANGYLSPCGCSSPMMGGTKRRATAIEKLGPKGRTILLENGGYVKSAGRQDEIKLETFGQLHTHSAGAGMNLSGDVAALGQGAVLSMARLSGGKLISTSLQPEAGLQVGQFRTQGPFVIGGVSAQSELIASQLGMKAISNEQAVRLLESKARQLRKSVILMLDGSRDEAIALARRFPLLRLIHYRSLGSPADKIEKVGNVWLASPGDGGRYLLRLVWSKDKFVSYSAIQLHPGFKDDPKAATIYRTYLGRVTSEELLNEFPRTSTPRFSGNSACGKCHTESEKVWRKSKHAIALKTLEREGHDRDPDCVECHVVGLASIYGFTSRKATPGLTDVGCESCHGPGAKHSLSPKEFPMGKVGEKSCMPCHKTENSPRFDFAKYWPKIAHK